MENKDKLQFSISDTIQPRDDDLIILSENVRYSVGRRLVTFTKAMMPNSFFPVLVYGNKKFTLSWHIIAFLAAEAGLFDEGGAE